MSVPYNNSNCLPLSSGPGWDGGWLGCSGWWREPPNQAACCQSGPPTCYCCCCGQPGGYRGHFSGLCGDAATGASSLPSSAAPAGLCYPGSTRRLRIAATWGCYSQRCLLRRLSELRPTSLRSCENIDEQDSTFFSRFSEQRHRLTANKLAEPLLSASYNQNTSEWTRLRQCCRTNVASRLYSIDIAFERRI